MSKVLIINPNAQYVQMFIDRGWIVCTHPEDIFEVDLIQFTGGEDVTPEIYGEENTHSYNNFHRDLFEAGIFALGIRLGKPMAGICRGGQFLNVMCGGKMRQDIPGHAIGGTHKAYDLETGKAWNVTSTHHQGMVSDETFDNGLLVAEANDGVEEVIYYRVQQVLCFQPHPEFHAGDCQDYYFECIRDYLGIE